LESAGENIQEKWLPPSLPIILSNKTMRRHSGQEKLEGEAGTEEAEKLKGCTFYVQSS